MLITDNHIFFYTNFLSNFHKTSFVWEAFGEKHTFFCTEQAFMWAKAMYFNDKTTAQKILQEKEDPLKCKRLGRLVSNYDDKKWDLVREDMMFQVNLCKYQQDDEMQKLILDPQFEGKTFVEASPTDMIWGCGYGLAADVEALDNEEYWTGRNLLGKVLTDVRATVAHDKAAS